MKSIIVGLVAVSMFISACNDSASTEEGKESILGQSKNMLDAEIDYFGGDLHQILELDTAALIDKYTVFSLELMLPRPNENGAYTRTISLMKGLQSVSEKDLAYYGSDPSEMQTNFHDHRNYLKYVLVWQSTYSRHIHLLYPDGSCIAGANRFLYTYTAY